MKAQFDQAHRGYFVERGGIRLVWGSCTWKGP